MADHILIIDDDERLADMLESYLTARGLSVEHSADAASGLIAVRSGRADAVVLDVMLPDLDGFEVCRRVRAQSQVPILMLTARGDEMDRIIGLELGADDYLPKPFNPRELLARLRAILRRSGGRPAEVLRFGRLEIDPSARRVWVDGDERTLTAHQFGLLQVLADRAGRVQTREQLMEAVRGELLQAYDRSIDVHISRIRAAIEDDASAPRRILTVRGVGYLFAAKQD